ncbi:hypothetical protein AB1Y20_005202 [Prymnesium parvum]|uniref:AB hydrolase-1 domain-containing protein n=1 Tax=Prymnesium parvum TaxID=97485 RepID=A0AB34J3X7_PRYPA
MDDFELRRLKNKELALQRAERDRLHAVAEVRVSFRASPSRCDLMGTTVSGLLANRRTKLAAVVCHPWGPLGGSMADPTVRALTKLLGNAAGLSTLRFNFRSGLGCGYASAADVSAAVRFVMHELAEAERVLLVGFSYGASVVASVAAGLADVCAVVLVAPPLGYQRALFMGRSPIPPEFMSSAKPKLALCGDSDQFCSQAMFLDFCSELRHPKKYELVHGGFQQCGDHVHHQGVHHFNLYLHIDDYIKSWLADTFGCDFEELASCDGRPVPQNFDYPSGDEQSVGESDT